MGGSGGGFRHYSIDQIRRLATPNVDETKSAQHQAAVSGTLNAHLADYNDRDTDLVSDRLAGLKGQLESDAMATLPLQYGGSVQKRTYVDGLSDIDALLILNESDLSEKPPRETLAHFERLLQSRLPKGVSVKAGEMALTVTYPDGMQLQLLPAIATKTGVRVSAAHGRTWSQVVRPHAFAAKLTLVNKRCGGKVVPVVKVVKAALARIPSPQEVSGYHVESLAVKIFASYSGPHTTKAMVEHFMDRAQYEVRTPIQDSTGQSLHVDDYMGPANSRARMAMSGVFNRISRRLNNANLLASSTHWLNAIGG